MIKFENTVLPSEEQWRAVILGVRNAMNSWEKSDSDCSSCMKTNSKRDCESCNIYIGPNDLDLMKRLRNAGTDHRKFMRMITVYVDITGPLYWWKEFDTYKVGTVANSCSTMHKIAAKEFTLEDFSWEKLLTPQQCTKDDFVTVEGYAGYDPGSILSEITVPALNLYRERYLKTKDKKYWWQMIQLLPSSYNQKRTVMMNYEVLANIYKSRKDHKLDEWSTDFCGWIKTLPYSELITGEFKGGEIK